MWSVAQTLQDTGAALEEGGEEAAAASQEAAEELQVRCLTCLIHSRYHIISAVEHQDP